MIVLTETWFNCGILDGELFIGRYVVYRPDRETKDLKIKKMETEFLLPFQNELIRDV